MNRELMESYERNIGGLTQQRDEWKAEAERMSGSLRTAQEQAMDNGALLNVARTALVEIADMHGNYAGLAKTVAGNALARIAARSDETRSGSAVGKSRNSSRISPKTPNHGA